MIVDLPRREVLRVAVASMAVAWFQARRAAAQALVPDEAEEALFATPDRIATSNPVVGVVV